MTVLRKILPLRAAYVDIHILMIHKADMIQEQ